MDNLAIVGIIGITVAFLWLTGNYEPDSLSPQYSEYCSSDTYLAPTWNPPNPTPV